MVFTRYRNPAEVLSLSIVTEPLAVGGFGRRGARNLAEEGGKSGTEGTRCPSCHRPPETYWSAFSGEGCFCRDNPLSFGFPPQLASTATYFDASNAR